MKEENITNYVYCLNFGDKIKVGKTIQPNFRFKTIEKISGNQIIEKFIIKSDPKLETLAHQHFAKYRTIGEYFKGLDFNEVCQWLEENRIEEHKEKINKQSVDHFKILTNMQVQEYHRTNLQELEDFKNELLENIKKISNDKKRIRAIKSVEVLFKNIKEIYLHNMQRFKDYECLDIQNNIFFTYKRLSSFCGFKVANKWVYNMKKTCLNYEHDFDKLLLLSQII